MISSREEFSQPTKDLLAERAGHRCSVPGCPTPTIGPGPASDESTSTGVACHIFSAAPNGPRGQGGLTPEQLRHPDNGFWACAIHGRIIDTHEGRQYPAETLRRWRESREARARREHGGLPLPDSWIESIRVLENRPRIFGHDQRLELSRVTLLIGGNGVGKTSLCAWLAGALDGRLRDRWHTDPLRFAIALHAPEPHDIAVHHADGETVFMLDGTRLPFNRLPALVQLVGTAPRQPHPKDGEEGASETEVALLARWLRCDDGTLRGLIPHLDYHRHPLLDRIRIDGQGKVLTQLRGKEREFSLEELSTHEAERVALTVAMARAEAAGPQTTSLLIVDGLLPFFDPKKAQAVLEALGNLRQAQSVVTLVSKLDPRVPPGRWSTVALQERQGGACIVPVDSTAP